MLQVKFGVLLVTRPIGVDIGRRVFDGLNSAELVHCFVLDFLYVRLRSPQVRIPSGIPRIKLGFPTVVDWIPILLTTIVLFQCLWLMPKLVENAVWRIATAEEVEIPPSRACFQKDLSIGDELCTRQPSAHKIYVVMELAKGGLLLGFTAWSFSLFL
eukprot:Gb_23813 [translate_table: standard]